MFVVYVRSLRVRLSATTHDGADMYVIGSELRAVWAAVISFTVLIMCTDRGGRRVFRQTRVNFVS